MRTIIDISANEDWTLDLEFSNGEFRRYDVKPLLELEAFAELKSIETFKKITNHGYFIEWDNEADLSSDTLYIEGIAIVGQRHQREPISDPANPHTRD